MNSRHTKRLGVDEKKDMLHTFQIRFDVPSGEEFLFNIYTGETVMTEDREHMIVDRYASTWRKREPPQDGKKKLMRLNELPFISRTGIGTHRNRWKHNDTSFITDEFCAILIQAAFRSYVKRKEIYKRLALRFISYLDEASGYVYFFDTQSATTSWHRPKMLCATLYLLTPPKNKTSPEKAVEQKNRRMMEDRSFTPAGNPRLNRTSDGRTDETGFRISYSLSPDIGFKGVKFKFAAENKVKTEAVRNDKFMSKPYIPPVERVSTPPNIDAAGLHEKPFALVILWMDNEAEKIDGEGKEAFDTIIQASKNGEWEKIVNTILAAEKRGGGTDYVIQCYGLHTLSRINVLAEGDSKIVSIGTVMALEFFMRILFTKSKPEPQIGDNQAECNYMLFVFHALYNIVSDHAGRSELFNTREADQKFPEYGGAWERARDEKYEGILSCLGRYLAYLPVEHKYIVLDKKFPDVKSKVTRTSKRGMELAEVQFLILSSIGREIYIREMAAMVCTQFILKGLLLVVDDVDPTVHGLRSLYNFCYRCQQAHTFINKYLGPDNKTNVRTVMDEIRSGSAFSEFSVRREYKRLQLALGEDGWRGKVEEQMPYPNDWEHDL